MSAVDEAEPPEFTHQELVGFLLPQGRDVDHGRGTLVGNRLIAL